jgi:hypothetical protein
MESDVAVPFGRRSTFARTAALAAVFLVAAGAPNVASAQGLFEVLRSIFGGSRPPVERVEPAQLSAGAEGAISGMPAEGGPHAAYCVRLCDGRYFPLPRSAGSQSTSPENVCGAMCPAAQTKIFSGTSIDRAVANDGKNYSGIKNAFLYREKMVDGCSCNGSNTGTAALEVENDPTLRRGDIVITRDGPKVFNGDNRLPHKSTDFVPTDSYKGLSKNVRNELSNMRVAEEPITNASVSLRTPPAVPQMVTPPSPVAPHASLTYAPVTGRPIVEAFASFRR